MSQADVYLRSNDGWYLVSSEVLRVHRVCGWGGLQEPVRLGIAVLHLEFICQLEDEN